MLAKKLALIIVFYNSACYAQAPSPYQTQDMVALNGQFHAQFQKKVINYYYYYNRANIIFWNGNTDIQYDSAIHFYQKAFSCMLPFNRDIYDLSQIYHSKKDYKNAVKYYYLAVKNGYLPIDKYSMPDYMLQNDSIPAYKKVIAQLDSLNIHLRYLIDLPFYELTTKLFTIDQHIRFFSFFQTDTFLKKDPGLIDRYVGYYDDKILEELLAYIEIHGIPHYNKMLDQGQAFRILVHHQIHPNNTNNNRLYELVRKAIEDGRLPNTFMKIAIDYKYMETGFQYFGSYERSDKNGKSSLSKPIDTIALVDKRRAEWQILPLGIDKTKGNDTNFILPEGYVTPSWP